MVQFVKFPFAIACCRKNVATSCPTHSLPLRDGLAPLLRLGLVGLRGCAQISSTIFHFATYPCSLVVATAHRVHAPSRFFDGWTPAFVVLLCLMVDCTIHFDIPSAISRRYLRFASVLLLNDRIQTGEQWWTRSEMTGMPPCAVISRPCLAMLGRCAFAYKVRHRSTAKFLISTLDAPTSAHTLPLHQLSTLRHVLQLPIHYRVLGANSRLDASLLHRLAPTTTSCVPLL